MYIGNPTDPAGLATVASTVTNWRNHVRAYGYADVYFYGIDEAKADVLKTERPAWQTVHDNGGKVFAAAGAANLQTVADVLDTAVVAYAPNTTIAGIFHRNNHEVFDYSNPQAGIENPGNLP